MDCEFLAVFCYLKLLYGAPEKVAAPQDFDSDPARQTCVCPAGNKICRNGSDCVPCNRRNKGRRFAIVEPVFANIRHNKRLDRFTLRGRLKVNAHWQLYCLVQNTEKLARQGYAQ